MVNGKTNSMFVSRPPEGFLPRKSILAFLADERDHYWCMRSR